MRAMGQPNKAWFLLPFVLDVFFSRVAGSFTTAGKSFEKMNYILHGYYICVHHEGTICKNLSLFLYLYADFVVEWVSSIVMQSN